MKEFFVIIVFSVGTGLGLLYLISPFIPAPKKYIHGGIVCRWAREQYCGMNLSECDNGKSYHCVQNVTVEEPD